MKRVVLYVKDKCPHCKDAQRYLDPNRSPGIIALKKKSWKPKS